ncbi:MAG: amidohydrolase family protein [Dehalococcoidia bacterium]|nr:amidohydrolase family protein [Dehalococcoidia bacterium]
MSKPDFVDAHVHFYDMSHPELFYAHWQPDEDHPVLGAQTRRLAERNWLAEDFIAVSRDSNVTKAVHVQAAIGSPDPVTETEWLQEAADRTGFPHAIVAYADLRDPGVEAVLERHCESPNMKGVRDFSYGDYLVEPDFHRGYALMEKYGLVASIAAQWPDMEKLRDLAARFPNTVIVLDHAGGPMERTPEYFRNWKQGMQTAAEAEKVICKISGLGMGDHNWTVDSIRPYVLHCIETFGVDRSLFATNWPVDSLWSDYDTIVNAYDEITADFTNAERQSLFSANTERLYRI